MSASDYGLFCTLYLLIGTSAYFLGGTVKWMTVEDKVLSTGKKGLWPFLSITNNKQEIHWIHYGTVMAVKFTYRLAWERGTGPCGHGCSEMDIGRNGNSSLPTLSGLHWNCSPGCGALPVKIGGIDYTLTSISRDPNGWEQGEGYFLYKLTDHGPYSIILENVPWTRHVGSEAPSLGMMKTVVNLSIRGDTGKPNGSPYASLPSIIGIQYNCTTTIQLPVEDPDGDLIRCRWAKPDECGAACTNVPPNTIILDRVKCTLTVSAFASTCYMPKWKYRLTLVVEDFPEYVLDFGGRNLTSRNILSAVPVQLSMKVIPISESCDTTTNSIKFVIPYLRHRVSYGAVQVLNKTLVIAPFYLALYDSETEFMASVPAMTTMARKPDKYDRLNVTIFEFELFPQIPDQIGDNQFCAWANDRHGITSGVRCVVVNIDDEDLCLGNVNCPNGTCINLYRREKCQCSFGFKPPYCSQAVTCKDFPCENNSSCESTESTFFCKCLPGYTGHNCEYEILVYEKVKCEKDMSSTAMNVSIRMLLTSTISGALKQTSATLPTLKPTSRSAPTSTEIMYTSGTTTNTDTTTTKSTPSTTTTKISSTSTPKRTSTISSKLSPTQPSEIFSTSNQTITSTVSFTSSPTTTYTTSSTYSTLMTSIMFPTSARIMTSKIFSTSCSETTFAIGATCSHETTYIGSGTSTFFTTSSPTTTSTGSVTSTFLTTSSPTTTSTGSVTYTVLTTSSPTTTSRVSTTPITTTASTVSATSNSTTRFIVSTTSNTTTASRVSNTSTPITPFRVFTTASLTTTSSLYHINSYNDIQSL